MQEVFEFLKACGTYYLATMDGEQPVCVRLVRMLYMMANSISKRLIINPLAIR